jgi:hypothetical protein
MCRSWSCNWQSFSLVLVRLRHKFLGVFCLQVDLFYPWKITPTQFYVKVILFCLLSSVICHHIPHLVANALSSFFLIYPNDPLLRRSNLSQPAMHILTYNFAPNLQFHDDLDELYGSDPYAWEQSITILSVDCVCVYPYAKCWENSSENFIQGCEGDFSSPQYLQVNSMSNWRKSRIEDVQVLLGHCLQRQALFKLRFLKQIYCHIASVYQSLQQSMQSKSAF